MLNHQKEYVELLQKAYADYLLIFVSGGLEPNEPYLKYDFDFIHSKRIHIFGN